MLAYRDGVPATIGDLVKYFKNGHDCFGLVIGGAPASTTCNLIVLEYQGAQDAWPTPHSYVGAFKDLRGKAEQTGACNILVNAGVTASVCEKVGHVHGVRLQ